MCAASIQARYGFLILSTCLVAIIELFGLRDGDDGTVILMVADLEPGEGAACSRSAKTAERVGGVVVVFRTEFQGDRMTIVKVILVAFTKIVGIERNQRSAVPRPR